MTDSPPARPDKSARGMRRASRSLAVQALYQWLIAGADQAAIMAFVREQDDFPRCDEPYFEALLAGCMGEAPALRERFSTQLDRPMAELSPVEHAILLLATYELMHQPEVPYRVVINEAVELGKSFGGTDGHKYINGVLDKLAKVLRPGG